ncbi:MAG: ATPase domain-containing protein, partial [Desulfurococcaceae archaeon]
MTHFTFNQDLFKYILPSGIPRNSLVVLTGEGGSGKSVILAHIVKDAILNNETVVYVALDDDPQTVVNQLSSFGLNAVELCSKKQLIILDSYSYLSRTKRPHQCVEEEISPDNPDGIITSLNKVVEKYKINESGLIALDSLNEVMILLDPTRFVLFIKSLRANFAKARSILTIATLHTSTEGFKEYLLTIEHLVDGILETASLPGEIAQQVPIFIRQISVRKIKGSQGRQGWILYGIDSEGLKPVVIT